MGARSVLGVPGVPALPEAGAAAGVLLCALAVYIIVQAWVMRAVFDRECDGARVARGFNACSFAAGACAGLYGAWALARQRAAD